MKTWKTVVITVFTTSALATAGALTYSNHNHHYKGDTHTIVSTSVSSTTSSTSVSSSTESIESNDSSDNTSTIYSESNPTEQVTEEYTTLWVYASALKGYTDRDGNKISRSGFYVLTPVQNHTNYVEVIEIDMRTNDEYHVNVYGNDDESIEIGYQSACSNAEQFCSWLREQAPDGHTIHGLQSNYDYWLTINK